MKIKPITNQDIINLAQKNNLLPVHRILLGHDGSMTKLLELIACEKVKLQTKKQEVIPCPKDVVETLELSDDDLVNERDILILRSSDEYPLLHAKSYTPISRLEPGFKSDLMRADTPIGRIMQKHHIEARRELMKIGILDFDKNLKKTLHNPGPYIWRSYNIITGGIPLITIRESFSFSLYGISTSGSS